MSKTRFLAGLLTLLLLVSSASVCLSFKDDLIRANLHTHDYPVAAIDLRGTMDHVAASWAPTVYAESKALGLTGVVMNPHGISMVNGHTFIDWRVDRVPYLYPIKSYRNGGKPAHWYNEMTWAAQATTDGFVALRAFEWSGSNHVDVIGSADWTDSRKDPKLSAELMDPQPDIASLCHWLIGNRVSIYGGDVVCQFNHVDNRNSWAGWRDVDFASLRESDGARRVWPMFSLMQILSGPKYTVLTSTRVPNISGPELIYFKALKAGWQVGPTVGEDNTTEPTVLSRINHTGVWVKGKTQKDFLEALRNRRVFATTCKNAMIDIEAEVVGTGTKCTMGGQLSMPMNSDLVIRPEIASGSKIGRVSLLEVDSASSEPRSVEYDDVSESHKNLEFRVRPSRTTVCYYIRVEHGIKMQYTWSAPIFLYHPASVKSVANGKSDKGAAGPVTTIFVIDCSGSMSSATPDGQVKLDAARNAAKHYLSLISFDADELGADHQVGIMSFSSSVTSVEEPTSNIAEAMDKLDSLSPTAQTDFGDALDQSLSWMERLSDDRRKGTKVLVFLSDGMTNVGPVSRDEFLVNSPDEFANPLRLYQRIKEASVGVFTVGFGDPSGLAGLSGNESGMDEDVLKKIATVPGTKGQYFSAPDAFKLDEVYTQSFHESTGDVVFEETGTIKMRDNKVLGPFFPGSKNGQTLVSSERNTRVSFLIPAAYAEGAERGQMLVTLGWSAGKLGMKLKDPSGRIVDESYPGAHIKSGEQPLCVAIDAPSPGGWSAIVTGDDVRPEGARFHLVVSARVTPSGGGGGGASQEDTAIIGVLVTLATTVLIAVLILAARMRTRVMIERRAATPAGMSQVRPEHAWLVGPAGDQRARLRERLTIIGRSSSCAVVLDQADVSRQHARIRRQGTAYVIEDLSSRFGTFVNGQRCSRQVLRNGDTILIGSAEFAFVQHGV